MTDPIDALRTLRAGLHDRAFEQHAQGRSEAAQALWSVVEELDHLITQHQDGGPE